MQNYYSPSEFFKNVYCYILTKIFFHQARFIRRPVYIRGRKSLKGGIGLTTGRFCRFDLNGKEKTLFIGDNCEFGDMTHIVAHERVEIGDNVLIASKCFISDSNHGNYKGDDQDNPSIPPNQRRIVTRPVKIGSNVWIGENAVVLAGAEIGDGCIIGANSFVNKYIPAGSMIVGAGKLIKRWDEVKTAWVDV